MSILKYAPLPHKQSRPVRKNPNIFTAQSTNHHLNIPFNKPTQIQSLVISNILTNKSSLFLANTGAGKTFGYVIGTLIKLTRTRQRVVIVLPTRELVNQVYDMFKQIMKTKFIKIVSLSSAHSEESDRRKLKIYPDVVITTSGRFRLVTNYVLLILDEVDLLIREGFLIDNKKNYQMICLSATLNTNYYQNLNLEVITVEEKKEIHEIGFFMRREEKIGGLCELISHYRSIIVFCSSKIRVNEIMSFFESKPFSQKVVAIHSDLDSSLREINYNSFKSRQSPILITTDISSRGLHLKSECIINYDIPDTESEIHRNGRLQKNGTSFTFYTSLELKYVKNKVFRIKTNVTKALDISAENAYLKFKRIFKREITSFDFDPKKLELYHIFKEEKENQLKNLITQKYQANKTEKVEINEVQKDQFHVPNTFK